MESIVDQAELIHWVDKTRNVWLIVEQLPIKSEATRTTIRPEFNIPTDILVLNARDHSTKRYSFLSFNLSTYMTIWPKIRVAIYFFFFYVHETIRPKYTVLSHLFFLLSTTIGPKIKVNTDLFISMYTTIRQKVRVLIT